MPSPDEKERQINPDARVERWGEREFFVDDLLIRPGAIRLGRITFLPIARVAIVRLRCICDQHVMRPSSSKKRLAVWRSWSTCGRSISYQSTLVPRNCEGRRQPPI